MKLPVCWELEDRREEQEECGKSNFAQIVDSMDGTQIALLPGSPPYSNQEGWLYAKLISKAPEMFDLLKYVVDKKENADEWHVWDTAKNLIQKIQGES